MEKTAYWQYLKTSLDIDDFMLPASSPAPSAASVQQMGLYNSSAALTFFVATDHLSIEEKTLFEKMIMAMGLSLEQVGLFLSTTVVDNGIPSRIRVIFSDDTSAPTMGQWQDVQGLRIFTTHSLKNLLQNPGLKKSAWEHLKAVRAALLL